MSERVEEKSCPFNADLMNPATFENFVPFDIFRSLRTKCPISYQLDSQRNSTFWAVTKRDDIDFISKNPKLSATAAEAFDISSIDAPNAINSGCASFIAD